MKIGIDLEGTLIGNTRSTEFQEMVLTSGDEWYLVTAYVDPLAVSDIVRDETVLEPDQFIEIVCTHQKAKACFERGIVKLIDDSGRYRKSCEKYGIEFVQV